MFSNKSKDAASRATAHAGGPASPAQAHPRAVGALHHQCRHGDQWHDQLDRRHPGRWAGRRRCPQRGPGDRRQGRDQWRGTGRGCDRTRQGLGRIRARKVLLAATSHVEGDILHEAFAVESGAFFEGNCRHSDNPLDDNLQHNNQVASRTALSPIHSLSKPWRAQPMFAPFSTAATIIRIIPGLRPSRAVCHRPPAPAPPP